MPSSIEMPTCSTQIIYAACAPILPITELGVIGHPERAERRQDAAVDRRDVHKTALVEQTQVTLGGGVHFM